MDAIEVIAVHRNGGSRRAREPAGPHARALPGNRESYRHRANLSRAGGSGSDGPIHSGIGVCPGDGVSRATTCTIRKVADGDTVVRDVDIP